MFFGGGKCKSEEKTKNKERAKEKGEGKEKRGVVSVGLGIDFYEEELNSRCSSPYKNPRPAPVPPAFVSHFGVGGYEMGGEEEEEEELRVPDYVFERRGSATSQCTTSSARSTKTLKERLTSFVPSIPRVPSLWSLKQHSHSRSKLNLTLTITPPPPVPDQPTNPPSSSTSGPGVCVNVPKPETSPFAKSARSYKTNLTVFMRSTDDSSEWPNTPRTPASAMSPPHSATSLACGPSIFPPSSNSPSPFGLKTSGSPSRSAKLIKRVSYSSRLYPPQNVSVGGAGLTSARNTMSGLGLGLGGDVVDEETEEEARAIGRVLTPEVDPFMRMPIGGGAATAVCAASLKGRPSRAGGGGRGASEENGVESEESFVGASEDSFVSADDEWYGDDSAEGSLLPPSQRDVSEVGHAQMGSTTGVVSPLVGLSNLRTSREDERTRAASRLTFGSSLEYCGSPPPRYSRLSPGPSSYSQTLPQVLHSTFSSESSLDLSFAGPEDSACGLPDSPVLPSPSLLPVSPRLGPSFPTAMSSMPERQSESAENQSLSSLAPSPVRALSPLSPVSTLSFTFPQYA